MNKYIKITILNLFIFGVFSIAEASSSFGFQEITLVKNDGSEISVPAKVFSKWTNSKPILIYDPQYKSEIEPLNYCETRSMICALTRSERMRHSLKKTEIISADKEEVKSFVEDLARKYDIDPVDATFTVENGKVTAFSLSKEGAKININENTQYILELFNKKNALSKIDLIYNIEEPEIKSNDASELGIIGIIGKGESNFSGSTKSRIHNVQVAASRFDGILIKPGEELSFVDTLGPVDGEHGYKQELVIKNNETTPEFGGGVCQVSTTAFRAAIYSGLEITARKNHAYPVHYYNPQGMDATIYIPRPDLRFKNNTPGHILIQTDIDLEEKELVFKFYGTDDGRKIKIDGPHITSRENDGSMKTIFTQTVSNKNDEIIIEDIFRSNYDSPDKYPQPGEETILTKKPKDWSDNEWKKYKKDHGL